MIELQPTQEQIERAKKKFPFGILKNSILHGDGNFIGALGEIVVVDYYQRLYGDAVKVYNTYDFDFIVNDCTVEVKTKKCTCTPQNSYNVSVSNSNTKQLCQYYCFVRVLSDYSKAWILGFIPKKKFYDIATFNRKGEFDPQRPEWTFKDDCYNLPINQLSI